MSHVDDGILHAYLDGELSPVERSRVEAHLAECDSCRERRDEERGLIERADRLLGLAALPSGHVNRPAPQIAARRRPRYLMSGAWAASIAAAFLVGWLLRPAPVTQAGKGEVRLFADQPTPVAAATPETATELRRDLRPRASTPDVSIGTIWVAISPGPARRMLGTEPVRIPGLPVRDILQNPLQPGEVMIEQEVAAGTVIQLLQTRVDTALALAQGYSSAQAAKALPDLQRTVGQLQVRISGPLSTDSLLKLLLLAR
jgi:hypothetical protein